MLSLPIGFYLLGISIINETKDMIQSFQLSDDIDSIVLFESLFCGFGALLLVFIACEFLQRLSNSYDTIGDAINDIEWYLSPYDTHMRLTFSISTIYAQKPLEGRFFGSMSGNREQFKQVRKIFPPDIMII